MLTDQRPLHWTPAATASLLVLLLAQFTAAYLFGTGRIDLSGLVPFLPPVFLTIMAPVAVFLTVYLLSPRFRAFILHLDIRLLTMIQHWRVLGFAFLLLYFFGILPGLFAWPAGVGDVLVGVLAFFVLRRIDRDPEYITSSGFLWFQVLGLLDFAGAVVTSQLTSGVFPALIPGGVTSAAMEAWPLNIFPSFFVPFFIIVHLAAILKVRALRQTENLRPSASPQSA